MASTKMPPFRRCRRREGIESGGSGWCSSVAGSHRNSESRKNRSFSGSVRPWERASSCMENDSGNCPGRHGAAPAPVSGGLNSASKPFTTTRRRPGHCRCGRESGSSSRRKSSICAREPRPSSSGNLTARASRISRHPCQDDEISPACRGKFRYEPTIRAACCGYASSQYGNRRRAASRPATVSASDSNSVCLIRRARAGGGRRDSLKPVLPRYRKAIWNSAIASWRPGTSGRRG